MVYKMSMKIDGGCRGNGYAGAVGAAAIVLEQKYGGWKSWAWALPDSPTPTSQRAELTAVIHALEKALEKARELDNNPYMDITIKTDSKYVHGCMTDWSFKWRKNGWINSAGYEVANRDLVEEAVDLDTELDNSYGKVNYTWIPRAENQVADKAVNEQLNEMQDEMQDEYPTSSDDE